MEENHGHVGVLQVLLYFLTFFVISRSKGEEVLSKENIVLERKLLGFGFHRDLETNIFVPSKIQDDVAGPECSLLLFQFLPPGVYADPFQLKALEHFGFPQILFDRDVDIEAAEYRSKHHELFMYINLSSYKPDQTTGRMILELSLPVHARYHKPLPWVGGTEPQAKISILHPGIYSNCSQADGHNTLKAPCDSSNTSFCQWAHLSYISYSPQVEMSIPTGLEQHKPLVITTTLVVTAVICALLCITIFTSKDEVINKKS